jgi:hypothetical protein
MLTVNQSMVAERERPKSAAWLPFPSRLGMVIHGRLPPLPDQQQVWMKVSVNGNSVPYSD